MSIATRKAGAVIRCTKCAGEIVVPSLEGETEPQPADLPPPGQAFESANFDVALTAAAPTPPPPSAPPLEPTPRSAGIHLSVALLLVSVGVVVILLISMFVAGFLIGRMTVAARAESDVVRQV